MERALRARLSVQVTIVGAAAMLWYGVAMVELLSALGGHSAGLIPTSAEQQAFADNMPQAVRLLWALHVVGGLAGSLLLLTRSRWCCFLLQLSLVGLLSAALYQYGFSVVPDALLSTRALAVAATTGGVAVVLLVYAKVMNRMGVLM